MQVQPAFDATLPTRRRFVSIVVPCLNEQLVIGEFVDWCHEGLRKAGVEGEVLIVDSSTDRSAEIAEARGARVLRVPKRGLGHAYLDALPHVRGDYVIMGDCDLTYDFREIADFITKLDEGHEFVMGTRMKGWIEPGAMPALHRYFGTPLTTLLLNVIYHSHFSDIHCGMRAMTLDALRRIDLQSTSWEYASEMVLKASRLRLRSAEVPIKFYRDREGRESHHKRSGWRSPWQAGWINLKVMFLFAPDFFLFWPCIGMLLVGLVLVLGLAHGQVIIGGIGFGTHWMLLGMTLATLGYSGLHLALLAKAYYNFRPRLTERIAWLISYDRGMMAGGVLIVMGVILDGCMAIQFAHHGFSSAERQSGYIGYGALGLMLIILGFQTITHTLVLQMVLFPRRQVDRTQEAMVSEGLSVRLER
jgi:glycosyltransferase involved in cell wall biosynthesis